MGTPVTFPKITPAEATLLERVIEIAVGVALDGQRMSCAFDQDAATFTLRAVEDDDRVIH